MQPHRRVLGFVDAAIVAAADFTTCSRGARLEARIDAAARPLRGYVEWDYVRWSYYPKNEWNVWLEDLKLLLRESLERMDERLGGSAAVQPGSSSFH